MKATFFSHQSDFRKWLEMNHQKETELLVGFYKVGSGKLSMTWSESVDEALCFGWIDSVRKSIDTESYCIRFTPRKASSIWSAVNIGKVEELSKAGLMTEVGLQAFLLRKENRSKVYSHENALSIAPGYEKLFKGNIPAWNFFSEQAPSYKKVIIHWVMSAKQEKTQRSRLEKLITESEQGRRIKLM